MRDTIGFWIGNHAIECANLLTIVGNYFNSFLNSIQFSYYPTCKFQNNLETKFSFSLFLVRGLIFGQTFKQA